MTKIYNTISDPIDNTPTSDLIDILLSTLATNVLDNVSKNVIEKVWYCPEIRGLERLVSRLFISNNDDDDLRFLGYLNTLRLKARARDDVILNLCRGGRDTFSAVPYKHWKDGYMLWDINNQKHYTFMVATSCKHAPCPEYELQFAYDPRIIERVVLDVRPEIREQFYEIWGLV